jgi:PDZ domain
MSEDQAWGSGHSSTRVVAPRAKKRQAEGSSVPKTVLWMFLAATVSIIVVSSAMANETDGLKRSLWHDPVLLNSYEEAAHTLINLQPFMREPFATGDYARIDKLLLELDGIGFVSSRTKVTSETKWIPSTGGSWINGRYVPYFGGTTVTTRTPKRKEASVWLSYNEIYMGFMYDMGERFRWRWCASFTEDSPRDGSKRKSVSFCFEQATLARKAFDAVFTLTRLKKRIALLVWSAGIFESSSIDKEGSFRRLNWTRGSGVLVSWVQPDSPAAAAGLREDDVVFEANGTALLKVRDISTAFWRAVKDKPNATLDLKAFRAGQEIAVQLTLRNPFFGEEKLRSPGAGTPAPTSSSPPSEQFGMSARNLTEQEFRESGGGVFVVSVDPNSIAAKMGLRAGDTLLEINSSSVANVERLAQLLAAGPVGSAKVRRGNQVLTLTRVRDF